jgi:hypothetical protein
VIVSEKPDMYHGIVGGDSVKQKAAGAQQVWNQNPPHLFTSEGCEARIFRSLDICPLERFCMFVINVQNCRYERSYFVEVCTVEADSILFN